jgi:hypothetical protein
MRNNRRSRLFVCVLSFATLSFSAAAGAKSSEAPVIVEGDAKAKKICKSEPVVGSRFAKKICHTQAEWLAIQQSDRVATEQYQRAPCRGGADSVGGSIQC